MKNVKNRNNCPISNRIDIMDSLRIQHAPEENVETNNEYGLQLSRDIISKPAVYTECSLDVSKTALVHFTGRRNRRYF